MEVNFITLENGLDYFIVEAIENAGNNYLFLVNENNSSDFCVRKVIVEDGKEYLTKLDSDEEFEDIMTKFNEKHVEKGENNNEE